MATVEANDEIGCQPSSANKALLLVSVGPVEEFIYQARKTRDVWVGSYLLSLAAEKAIEAIKGSGGQIIMPCLQQSASTKYASVPNRILAIVNKCQVDGIGNKIVSDIRTLVRDIGSEIKREIDKAVGSSLPCWSQLWDSQLEDCLQVMWVAIPITDKELNDSKSYQEKHDEIQKFLIERKATRTFSYRRGSNALKCSQCGQREAMGPEGLSQNRSFWDLLCTKGKTRWLLKKSEKLCAVCLTKRMVTEDQLGVSKRVRFDSTSDVASTPFRELLKALDTQGDLVKKFIEAISALSQDLYDSRIEKVEDIPGEWLYSESLREEVLLREFGVDQSKASEVTRKAKEAKEKLEQLYENFKTRPSEYYSVAMLDADRMGEFLSGKKGHANEFSPQWQSDQSGTIAVIGTGEWPAVADKHQGMAVYSAGDGFLGFFPVRNAIPAICELREKFREKFAMKPTISGCLVIVHRSYPLQSALREARKGLEIAKDAYLRDSLVIILRLRSGSSYLCGYKWQFQSDGSFAQDVIETMAEWMRTNKGLSPRLIYDILSEVDAFYYSSSRGNDLTKELLEVELDRLFERHIPQDSPIRKEHEKIKNLKSLLLRIASCSGDYIWRQFDPKENFVSLLKVIEFLSREG